MILWKIITHPLTLIASFCLFIVSGQYLASFFIQNVMGGLGQQAIFSWIGAAGIILLAIMIFRRQRAIELVGSLLLILSVLIFFLNAPASNVSETFTHPAGIMSLFFFVVISCCFIGKRVFSFRNSEGDLNSKPRDR